MPIIKKEVENVVSHEGETKVVESKHIISIVGLEKSDFPFYLGKLLEQYHTKEGYRDVLLVDNSDTKSLFNIVNHIDEEEYTINRMTFVKDIDYSEDYFDHFSFVIIFHGMDIDKTIIDKSDMTVFVTDYNPSTYNSFKNIFDDFNGTLHIMYRDWLNKKIKESVIEDELNIKKDIVESRSIIKASLEDMNAYIILQHSGNLKLKSANLSELFQETLKYYAEMMTGADEKTVQQLYKKAN